jgi:hypothetical protein
LQAICLYWCTSNFLSLAIARAFKVPAVRKALNIPQVKQNTVKKSDYAAAKDAWASFRPGIFFYGNASVCVCVCSADADESR